MKDFAKKILREEIKQLEEKVKIAEAQALIARSELERAVADPRLVVKAIFQKDISWFDYMELPDEQRKRYFDEAQLIVKGIVLENEMNFLKATGSQAAIEQANGEDPVIARKVRDFQMTLNAFELFRDRLKEISAPPVKTTVDEEAKHNPI